jgi:hypothetical protein
MSSHQEAATGTARWLGYLGLIPFVAGGALALFGDGVASGLPALLVDARTGLALLIAAFLGIWIHERVSLWSTLFPAWFARLRTQLTSVAVIVLALLLTVSP